MIKCECFMEAHPVKKKKKGFFGWVHLSSAIKGRDV